MGECLKDKMETITIILLKILIIIAVVISAEFIGRSIAKAVKKKRLKRTAGVQKR